MAYGYQGITIYGRFAEAHMDCELYKIHFSGNGGTADITIGADAGEVYVEVAARNDAFNYDFHERVEGPIEREDIEGGRILRFKTVNRYMGTVVIYNEGPAENRLMLEVF